MKYFPVLKSEFWFIVNNERKVSGLENQVEEISSKQREKNKGEEMKFRGLIYKRQDRRNNMWMIGIPESRQNGGRWTDKEWKETFLA